MCAQRRARGRSGTSRARRDRPPRSPSDQLVGTAFLFARPASMRRFA